MIESSTQKGFKPNDSCVNQLISIANSIFMHLSLILDDDGDDDDDDDDDDDEIFLWAGIIVRDSHHRESPTCHEQRLNLRRT